MLTLSLADLSTTVMAFLCLEPEPEPDVDRALDDINAIPVFELELASSSESEEDD
jgi:hypothetical protein